MLLNDFLYVKKTIRVEKGELITKFNLFYNKVNK